MKFKKEMFLWAILLGLIFCMGVITNKHYTGNYQKDDESSKETRGEMNLKTAANEIIILSPEEIDCVEPMSGYFPATYGFENDPDGTDDPFWTDGEGDSEIVNSLSGHSKVYQCIGVLGVAQAWGSLKENGTIELYMYEEDATQPFQVQIQRMGLGVSFGLRIINDKFQFCNATGFFDTGKNASDNTWYHLRIDYETTTGDYMGLSQWYWRILIDGEIFGNYGFINNWIPDRLYCYAGPEVSTARAWDAVGYSWDPNYEIGDNLKEGCLLSFETSTNLDWMGYSLDGNANKTIYGNTTLSLPNFGFHTIQVFGNNTLGEVFQSEIRTFYVTPISINTPEEKMYSEPMNGYYPATYGFENEKYGTLGAEIGYTIEFVDTFWRSAEMGYLWARIQSEWQGHNNVLSLIDSQVGSWLYIRHENFNETNGALEWYWGMNTNGSTHDSYFRLMNGETIAFEIRLDGGSFAYTGSSSGTLTNFDADTWYHHRLLFDCAGAGNGRFTWIISNESGIEIDRIENIEFINNVESIDKLHIETTQVHTGGHRAYFDAFGFSWDGYNLGDNLKEGLLLSFENATNLDWMGYSLDGQVNKTILGNTTLLMPNFGLHTIQVFGNDSLGTMYYSDIRHFSRYYILTGTPIFIDDSDPNYNWSKKALENPWCNGSGAWNDPYIIEWVWMDGNNIGSCITINNSRVYFIIRNCVAYNAGSGDYDAGIKLRNTNNGILTNNNCSNNNLYGIFLYDGCDNNTISGNTASNVGTTNQDYGIHLWLNCDDNKIINNTANDNMDSGIRVYDRCDKNIISNNIAGRDYMYQLYGILLYTNCDDNRIMNNTANNNLYYGIYLVSGCGNNMISGNIAGNIDTTFILFMQVDGIALIDGCDNNTIFGNNATMNQQSGIHLDYGCDDNKIINNTANDNMDYGILLFNGCNNNTISDNIAGNVGTTDQNIGILLAYCHNNTIVNNMANNNMDYGIKLDSGSDNNTISDNTASNEGTTNQNRGIFLERCDNNTIEHNTANNNSNYGIYLITNCTDNKIVDNTVNNNLYYGIYLYDGCDNNTISNNTACNVGTTNQFYGITLENNCDDNKIINNTANDNKGSGFYLVDGCDNNTIADNTASDVGITNQIYGIILENNCDDNKIINNIANDNMGVGIVLSNGCDKNIISDNIADNVDTINQHYGICFSTNCDDNTIMNNTINNNVDYGIVLNNGCDNNTISGNIASNVGTTNQHYGIYINYYCDDNKIINNIANNNMDYGIYLYNGCDNNTISGNNVGNEGTLNQEYGIFLDTNCDDNKLINNTANDNTGSGVRLYSGCDNNIISGMEVFNNTNGIFLESQCYNNTVLGNEIFKNVNGILINDTCSYNNITENLIHDNIQIGVLIKLNSNDNLIFKNNFTNPTVQFNAFEDDTDNNLWDNGSIGNYWDDYLGFDINGDGIGDMPYSIPGTGDGLDLHPIWGNPPPIYIAIINFSFSIEVFNLTFFIYNYRDEGIPFATIQMWWNGEDVSDDIIDLPGSLYFVILTAIPVAPGESPILLNMTISAIGYNDKYFEIYLAVDPELIEKIPEPSPPSDGDGGGKAKKTEESAIPLVAIGVGSAIGVSAVAMFLIRKRKLANREIEKIPS